MPEPTDVTRQVGLVREAGRHLWNTAFLPGADWDARDRFSRVLTELFAALVLEPLGSRERLPALWEADPAPIRGLEVIPPRVHTQILINRATQRTGYWDDPTREIAPGEATLAFVRFFDWDELAERSFEWIEVEIQRFDARPQLVGRRALIRSDGARVVWRAPTSS